MAQEKHECKNWLPIIALVFAFAPMLWLTWYVPFLRFFVVLFLFSYFGVILQIIGLIMGIIALFVMLRRKNADLTSVVFSIIAILAPFVWIFILFAGAMDYIMLYK